MYTNILHKPDDSQGYGGGIRTRFHPGSPVNPESELLYDWRFTANQFILAPSPLRATISIFFFQLNACGYSPYVTPYLHN
jgi:hypothetical protein